MIVAAYGYWVYNKKKKALADSKDFFLAEGALTWWAIGASLIASNISAEQSPPEAHSWLPRPHAHQRRTGSTLAPPAQGPQAPRCLSGRSRYFPVDRLRSEALPKQYRLAKRREFLRVYESGRKLFSRYAVVFFAANGLTYSRIGITATKKAP